MVVFLPVRLFGSLQVGRDRCLLDYKKPNLDFWNRGLKVRECQDVKSTFCKSG